MIEHQYNKHNAAQIGTESYDSSYISRNLVACPQRIYWGIMLKNLYGIYLLELSLDCMQQAMS